MDDASTGMETGLAPDDQARLRRGLAERGLRVELEGEVLAFHDAELARATERWVERLIRYNRRIHELARRRGRPIPPYKTRDLVNLYLAVITALEQGDLASLAHEVVWWQPFANANHRTVTAALLEELEVDASAADVERATHDAFRESKRLLDGSDTSLTNEEAKQRHLEVMRGLVEAIQSMR